MDRALTLYQPVEVGPQLMRAAQYVRMSTEHQRYSPLNQMQAIEQYAKEHGFIVVKTYTDHGKSGLRLKNRLGLQQLLDDVINRRRDYDAILILDVSRWGRFQDPDESAACEYLCRSAGVQVIYCAEPFPAETGPLVSIMKVVKRSMAAEFSRELSARVHRSLTEIVAYGYWAGGAAPYGLRRQVLDSDGQPRETLRRGQHKPVSAGRVILVPGSRKEVSTVRRVFRLYVGQRLPSDEIAALLNSEGLTTIRGGKWRGSEILHMLKNEKYIGTNIYNRKSSRVRTDYQRNHPRDWVRAEGVLKPIVPHELFEAARRRLENQTAKLSNAQMLDRLRNFLDHAGYLTSALIDGAPDMPTAMAYRRRFGSLVRAYALIAYHDGKDTTRSLAREANFDLLQSGLARLADRFKSFGIAAELDPLHHSFRVDRELAIRLVVACYTVRCRQCRWVVHAEGLKDVDVTVALCHDRDRKLRAVYLLPSAIPKTQKLWLGVPGRVWLDAYRCDSIDPLLDLVTAAKTSGKPFAELHREWAQRNAHSLLEATPQLSKRARRFATTQRSAIWQ